MTWLGLAILWSQTLTTDLRWMVPAAAVYGLSRFAASYGLLHLKKFGMWLELMSSVGWIAFAVYNLVKTPAPFIAVPFLPGILIAVGALIYLFRPPTRALFTGGGLRFSVAGVVVLVLVAGVAVFISMKVARASGMAEQKRTMADMRTIATAWEARATDFNRYNAAAITFPTTGVTTENLVTSLTPTYVRQFLPTDGWGNRFAFGADQPWDSKTPAHSYAIISYGKDGRPEGRWNGGEVKNFDCDIVFSDGVFLQYPEGIARQ